MRIAIYGFHQNSLIAAVDSLQESGAWHVVYWVGADQPDRQFDENIIQWHLGNLNWESSYTASAALAHRIETFITALSRDHWEQFQDQLLRHPFGLELTDGDVSKFLYRLLHKFVGQLEKSGAQALLTQNLPHQGFDLALYWAAKISELPVTLCYQTILPNRFFFCHELSDFGWFRQIQTRATTPAPPLPDGFEKQWFYMQDLPSDHVLHNPQQLPAWKQTWRDFKLNWKAWKQFIGWYRWIGKQHGFNVEPSEHYHWNLRRHAVSWSVWAEKNQACPVVYFPLHLQPELTSSTLGDQYRDQLRALQALSDWIPKDARIVIKENPKQTHRYRDQSFFDQLRKIKRAVFIGKIGNTHEIMRRATFVATLSGTVGWEAINAGKNVLVFGRPWYLTLPGVYYWPQQPNWNQLCKQSIERTGLEQAFRILWDYGRPGIVDLNYAAATPEFSGENNRQLLTEFFEEQIEYFMAAGKGRYIIEK